MEEKHFSPQPVLIGYFYLEVKKNNRLRCSIYLAGMFNITPQNTLNSCREVGLGKQNMPEQDVKTRAVRSQRTARPLGFQIVLLEQSRGQTSAGELENLGSI